MQELEAELLTWRTSHSTRLHSITRETPSCCQPVTQISATDIPPIAGGRSSCPKRHCSADITSFTSEGDEHHGNLIADRNAVSLVGGDRLFAADAGIASPMDAKEISSTDETAPVDGSETSAVNDRGLLPVESSGVTPFDGCVFPQVKTQDASPVRSITTFPPELKIVPSSAPWPVDEDLDLSVPSATSIEPLGLLNMFCYPTNSSVARGSHHNFPNRWPTPEWLPTTLPTTQDDLNFASWPNINPTLQEENQVDFVGGLLPLEQVASKQGNQSQPFHQSGKTSSQGNIAADIPYKRPASRGASHQLLEAGEGPQARPGRKKVAPRRRRCFRTMYDDHGNIDPDHHSDENDDDDDIQFQPRDSSTRLRERNRLAAAKCRSKKKVAIGNLQKDAQEMESRHTSLLKQVLELQTEHAHLKEIARQHSIISNAHERIHDHYSCVCGIPAHHW